MYFDASGNIIDIEAIEALLEEKLNDKEKDFEDDQAMKKDLDSQVQAVLSGRNHYKKQPKLEEDLRSKASTVRA